MRKLYIFFLLISILSFGQNKNIQIRIDSLLAELPKLKENKLKVDALNDISLFYGGTKPSKGIEYGKQCLALATKLNLNENDIAQYTNDLGRLYFQKLDYKMSLIYYQEALKLTKNKLTISNIYNNLSMLYNHKSNYNKAIYYGNNALKISEELNNNVSLSAIYSTLASIYSNLLNYQKSYHYIKKAIKLNTYNNPVKLANDQFLLANCCSALNFNKEAAYNYEQSIESSHKMGYTFNEVITMGEATNFFYNTKQYDKALYYNNRILATIGNDTATNSFCKNLSGNIYLQKARVEKNQALREKFLDLSVIGFEKSIITSQKLKDNKLLYEYYQLLSESQKMLGDYKESLKSYEKSIIYKDSIFNADNKETIKNLEDKRVIELRDKEIKINKLALESQEKQKWFYILGIGFLAVIGSLLFYQSRNRQKTNQKLQVLNTNLDEANKTKTRFFSILNHDLRSPVSNLIHFLHLQKENPELLDEESKTRLQNKTIAGAENLLTSMEDILLWSKGQMDNFKPQPKNIFVSSLFEDTQKHFASEERVKISFVNKQNIELVTDENYLKTILRNLTGNAIKALEKTQNPSIVWKAWQENNQNYLSITDNGPGGNKDKFKALYDDTEVVGIKTGLGLHLIRDLATAINAEIKVDSKVGEGTTFTLKL